MEFPHEEGFFFLAPHRQVQTVSIVIIAFTLKAPADWPYQLDNVRIQLVVN